MTGKTAKHRGGKAGNRSRNPLFFQELRAWLSGAARMLLHMVQEETDRWFLWLPVGLGTGIAIYFSLRSEPSLVLLMTAAILLAGASAAAISWRPSAAALLLIPVMVFTGFAAVKIRTDLVAAPVLARQNGPVEVTGHIAFFEQRPDGGYRITLYPKRIDRLKAERLPYRIRLTVKKYRGPVIEAGDSVRLRAILMPPPDAVLPGGFSYARQAWFERIGATGFVISPIQAVQADSPGLIFEIRAAVARWRMEVTDRIRAGLPGQGGGVAAALITGVRGGLQPEIRDALRDAGLAHLMAISGLHMALFGGGLYLFVRRLLALNARLALGQPIKKWAALTALAGSAGYLVLSGASIATQRAFIMTGIMFLAILMDRRAISMRNVALAAIAILALRPESLMSVSFQMSFGAVVALIAVYETGLSRGWFSLSGKGFIARVPLRAGHYLAGLAITSLVAGAATAPFALFHFHRVAVYGLIGNMLAVPVMGLVIMPAALLSLMAMPFGLEAFPLQIMERGINAVVLVSTEVAGMPGAVKHMAAFSVTALGLIVYGGLFLALWRRRWRFLGILPLMLGLLFGLIPDKPDVLIDREGNNIAVRNGEGKLSVLYPRKAAYSVRKWLEADGDGRTPKQAARGTAFSCDGQACVASLPGGSKLSYILRRDAVQEDCGIADIVIAKIPIRKTRCRAQVIIDLNDVRRHGAHALYVTDDEIIDVVHAAGEEGNRPWSRTARRAEIGKLRKSRARNPKPSPGINKLSQ